MSATVIRLTPQEIDEWRLARDIEEICRDKYRIMAADCRVGDCPLAHPPVTAMKPGYDRMGRGCYRRRAMTRLH